MKRYQWCLVVILTQVLAAEALGSAESARSAVRVGAAESLPMVQDGTLATAVQRVARTFAPASTGRTVAVFELPNLENQTNNLTRLVSEQLTTELVKAVGGRGKVVERRHVLQVLTELNLVRANLTRDELVAASRQLGANAIVLGSTQVVGGRILLNIRLVSIPEAQILQADNADVSAHRDYLRLAQEGLNGPSLTRQSNRDGPRLTDAPAAGTPRPSRLRQVVQGDTWELMECRHLDSAVRCSGTITSDEDGRFTIGDDYMGVPRVYDERGLEYNVIKVTLNRASGTRKATSPVVAGIPAQFAFEFDGVPATSRVLSLVVLEKGLDFSISFRNVPLIR